MRTKPIKYVKKGRLVNERVLGVPISYTDEVNAELSILAKNDVIEPEVTNEESEPFKDNIEHRQYLRTEFLEEVFTEVFFTIEDIVAMLGGISASAGVLICVFGTIFIVTYV